jgi:hypothetical protein
LLNPVASNPTTSESLFQENRTLRIKTQLLETQTSLKTTLTIELSSQILWIRAFGACPYTRTQSLFQILS